MSNGEPAPAPIELNADQLEDLATLLAGNISPGNLRWFAVQVLGPDVLMDEADGLSDALGFARHLVDAMNRAGRIAQAVGLLRQEAVRNGRLVLALNRILRGDRLGDQRTQAFVNEYEPFFNTADFRGMLDTYLRRVCAVGLGAPYFGIKGSGFLVGPDLVMTNFHVIEEFLSVDPADGKITTTAPGTELFCCFDYVSAPAPQIPPPANAPDTASLCVSAVKDDWLVYARKSLSDDGKATCPLTIQNEYDYAVIRLSRSVGKLPARLSSGVRRGWVTLPTQVPGLEAGKRIVVFQHPERAPQQFDIGDYVQMDASGTRFWYSVSTAHGSSGGAAADDKGQLVALHNAEVEPRAGLTRRVNQGVRIDSIARDLKQAVNWSVDPAPADDPLEFWSLSDSASDPQPIIGRMQFRQDVTEMTAPGGRRVMTVTGPPGSGVRFSIQLLRRTLGTQATVVVFSPMELQTLDPVGFLEVLVRELGILALAGEAIPEIPAARSTETVLKWLRLDLPRWLLARLVEEEKRVPSRFPAWIVVNTRVEPGERFRWKDNLDELLAALAGKHDPGQTSEDVPQLRWLFLGTEPAALPVVAGIDRYDEDLAGYDTYRQDFATCLDVAWRSVDKQAPPGNPQQLRTFASLWVQNNSGAPVRKVLADYVRALVLDALTSGGQP